MNRPASLPQTDEEESKIPKTLNENEEQKEDSNNIENPGVEGTNEGPQKQLTEE